MRWTSEKPASAGWWWQRYSGNIKGCCVRIEWNRGGMRGPAGPGDELYLMDGRLLADMETSEWSDTPIEPPV